MNIPYVTIKICNAAAACQTIDHIEVDTGSSGLRILGSVLTIDLPVSTLGGKTIAECTQFADGSSFGPLAVVDLTLPSSNKTVSNLAIQVIGATNYPTVPADCPGTQENSVESFGANGILGVGPFIQDCGGACAGAGFPSGFYYTCTDPATCTGAAIATAQQVSNPVNFFSSDDNGVIVELPGGVRQRRQHPVRFAGVRHQHPEQQHLRQRERGDREHRLRLRAGDLRRHGVRQRRTRQRLQRGLLHRQHHHHVHARPSACTARMRPST